MADAHEPLIYRFGGREYDLASRTHVMGVLNVTPDSFSDGGAYLDPARAVERALAMEEEGADFIDVGGESSRPRGRVYGGGAPPVDESGELQRVLPVLERLAGAVRIPLSIDTTKAGVAARALEAGAVIVNDISGFRMDDRMAATVAQGGASAVVMHMPGTPQTMPVHPVYADLLGEVAAALRDSVETGRKAGIRQIIVDPGIGFGKTGADNLRLIRNLDRFAALGCPVLVGPSRKAFIGEILDLPVGERLEGTLAAVVAGIFAGARIVRVHDVKEVVRAARVADALRGAS